MNKAHLAIANLSRNIHPTIQMGIPLPNHGEFDCPVVHQQDVSDFRGGDDFRMGKHDSCVVAKGFVEVEAKNLVSF